MKFLRLEPLTSNEKNDVRQTWKSLGLNINPLYFRMFKTCEHFDPKWVSDDLFNPVILRGLNQRDFALAYEHKAFYHRIFTNKIGLPRTLLVAIRGVYLDDNNNILTIESAADLLRNHSFVIKPTSGSCMGRNVRKYLECKDPMKVLSCYGEDFIVQEIACQSEVTAKFNKSTLNTFRISTLYLNGKESLCSILFRIGQGNNVVDNMGAGGLGIGVDIDGKLRPYAYDNKYKKYYQTQDGILFDGQLIPNMSGIVDKVLHLHKTCLPHIGFAGWDIAIDRNGDPLLIEVNLFWPGIQFEQLCANKPIFGERTEEVIDFVMSHKQDVRRMI